MAIAVTLVELHAAIVLGIPVDCRLSLRESACNRVGFLWLSEALAQFFQESNERRVSLVYNCQFLFKILYFCARPLYYGVFWVPTQTLSFKTVTCESIMNRTVFSVSVALTVALLTSKAKAGITFDYSNDGGFFASHLVAKAALEKAAGDINAVINYNLTAVTNDVTVGTSAGGSGAGGKTLNFDFKYTYTNPSSGAEVDILNTAIAANEVRIFVGMRNLAGSTLGEGGPGGVGLSVSGSDAGGGTFAAAVASAQAADQHRRGGGPTISTLSGSIAGAPFSFDIGSNVGNLWFDSDTDNNGATDNDATLNANWHFDSTSAVAAGKSDFYSVALHETLHAIGFGTSQTWNSLITGGDDWTGANAIAAAGTGVNIIDLASGAHIASGIMSTRLSDGGLQQTVMSPSITTGTRKSLTALDVAFLQDLNYSIVAVPEPSSMLLIAAAVGMVAARARRKKSSPETADSQSA